MAIPKIQTLFRGDRRLGYPVLLGFLLLMFGLQPLIEREVAGVELEALLLAAVLLGAIAAVGRSRVQLLAGAALGIPALVLSAVARDPGHPLWPTGTLLIVAFLLFASGLILAAVASHRRVTTATVSGALCVYLLLPLVWVCLYELAEWAQPGSFRGLSEEEGLTSQLYSFSLVTITTLGYGDVSPAQPWARVLATLEAIVGQLFLAVLVARLVGLQVGSSPGGTAP